MKFGKDIFLVLGFAGVTILASCVDHAADSEAEQEQVRQDSIVQADADNAVLDQYIADPANGIDESQVKVGEFGVRRIVWDPATSVRIPDFNDVVSVHYIGKLTNNDVFDTSSATDAKKSDSLDYVAADLSFATLAEGSSLTYEGILDSLNTSTGAIDDPQYSSSKLYLPVVFNHQENGSGISFNFITGFRSGLKEVMLEMQLNSRAQIMIPSAVAYGTTGTVKPDGSVGIPPNSPLIFEFRLVNIRP